LLTVLWTYENQAKTDPFIASLQEAEIPYETQSKAKQKGQSGEVTIFVDEKDYARAKKILMKHRKRRTST